MSMRPGLIAFVLVMSFPPPSFAQLAPPMLRTSKPIGAAPGETVLLEMKGSDVRDGAALRFDDPKVKVEGLELGKAEGNGLRSIRAQVTIPAEAGSLGFRIVTDGGVSNPGRIMIGRPIPTVAESEPNDRLRKPQVISVPSAVEGSIINGDDVDVFAVEMKAGETLVAEAIAARAGSRLDAWVTILSPDGRELASDDDLFGRDAAAWATIPLAGRYLVTIQDANGRLRDASIEQKMTRPYRLEVGRFPVVGAPFPAGARRGRGAVLRMVGANLPEGPAVRFDPPMDAIEGDHLFTIKTPLGSSNPLTLRVGGTEEFDAPEPDDDFRTATTIIVPAAINGTFAPPDPSGGDTDVFRLKAAPGLEGDYAISILAARVGSPADPVLAVLDLKGEVQSEDDDKLGRDARIDRRIDAKDGLLISVRDYFGRGGDRYVYRIEVEPVRKGLAIAAELGHRTIPRSGALAVRIAVDRRGFEGPVTVLAGELPEGMLARPVTIPPGETRGLLVVSASSDARTGAFPIRLTARDAPAPASFTFQERGPIDEVPRENDPKKGPRETTIDATGPVLAVAERASMGFTSMPEAIVATPGSPIEWKVTIDRRTGSEKKPVKVRLLAPGKALEGFEPVKDLDIKPDGDSATFVLKAKPDAAPRSVTMVARAWVEGTPDLLGVDSPAVVLVVPDRPRP